MQGIRTLHGALSEASIGLHFVYQPNWITIVQAHTQTDQNEAMFQWWKQRPDLSCSSCVVFLCLYRWVLKVFFFFSIELQRKREFSRFCGFTRHSTIEQVMSQRVVAIQRFTLQLCVFSYLLRYRLSHWETNQQSTFKTNQTAAWASKKKNTWNLLLAFNYWLCLHLIVFAFRIAKTNETKKKGKIAKTLNHHHLSHLDSNFTIQLIMCRLIFSYFFVLIILKIAQWGILMCDCIHLSALNSLTTTTTAKRSAQIRSNQR